MSRAVIRAGATSPAQWAAFLFASLGVMVFALPGAAQANVTIKRDPPTVEYKIFDPADPPADMPRLNQGESAVTYTVFGCAANARYSVIDRKAAAGQKVATIELSGLQLTLRLQVVIYLPKNAPEKLKAHEEGHRRIAEQVYRERAETAAREVAADADHRKYEGEGGTAAAATKAAVQSAINPVAGGYLKLTADVSARVGEIYDDITAHGTNKIPEDEAIKKAFEQYEKEQAEKTSPATTRPAEEGKK
ncbi:MAG TPA: hypothetical protein VG269_09065 [Tepidisphaeraceae bacterium]|jgi:hypothetical protein|nr:hypothetical protein [Tepidisphaeraceae bacterium]